MSRKENNMGLRFSVATVVYNAEYAISKTLESVLNQTYTPFEYLIIDGCSSDRTLSVIETYHNKFIEKKIILKIISEKDNGIYNAMNKAITNATGDFLSFINAGDWYEQSALQNINDFYQKKDFDLTYGGLHYINPNGSITNKMSKNDIKGLVTSRHWNHPSMFLKTNIYKKYYFDESYKVYSDFDLYLKLRKANVKILVIDKIITNFIADGVSTNVGFKNVIERAREKYAAYKHNGYSPIYYFESYGWEIFKSLYFRIRS